MTKLETHPARQHFITSGIVLIVFASLFWSLNGALINIVNQGGKGPGGVTIAFYRSLVAGLFLLPFSLGKWTSPAPSSQTAAPKTVHLLKTPAAIWCLIFFTLMTVSFVVANTMTAPASVIILQYTSTFWIFGLSPLVLGERPRTRDLWVLGMAFGGVVVIFAGEAFDADPQKRANMLGLVFSLASGLFYGLLTLMLRKLRYANSAAVTVYNNLGSAVLLFPVLLLMGGLNVSTRSLLLLVLMGIVQFGLPYYLYTLGLARVPAYKAALITLIEPVLVPIWAYLAVASPLPKYTVVGGGLILVALVLSLRAARRNALAVESA